MFHKRDKLDERALPGIFIAIARLQKLIKFSSHKLEKLCSRDVHFMEDEEWNWDDARKMDQASKDLKLKLSVSNIEEQGDENWHNEIVDDVLFRGTSLLLTFMKDAT